MSLSVGEIAHVCHEANRALQKIVGDASPSPHWEYAPADQRRSSRHGVSTALSGATPEQLHAEWCRVKHEDGWTWGPEKNPLDKTHPCLVPYADLPPEQRLKDALFHAIVATLSERPAADTGDTAAEVAGLTGLLEQAADALTAALGGALDTPWPGRPLTGHLSAPLRTGLVAAIQKLATQRDQAREEASVADARIERLTEQLNAAHRRITELEIELQEARS
ncbi:RyR domain-containing protein [Rhodococcus rhodochrous]|uniref:RyR domain-containing protein n=1 Tax=Rhodococcus rhodochrous TaxID=1829 RepID=UPI001CE2A270|nr:RyR domain-containing protein [Rhodococcus rhodochrous]